MNSISLELTMQELAQTALGVPKITGFNVSVLQSLIDLILKKLDCQSDTVTTTGYESLHLQQLLRQSKNAPLPLKPKQANTFAEKLKRLSALEDRMVAVKKKLDDHLAAVAEYNNKHDTSHHWEKWSFYPKVSEDVCAIFTYRNLVGCSLLKNENFVQPLMRQIADPLAERLKASYNKIENIHVELLNFTRLANERCERISLINGCMIAITKLHMDIEKEESRFQSTMEEIERMLDAKLEKIYVHQFQNSVRKSIADLRKLARKIKKPPVMPKPRKRNTKDCLSCGGVKTCSAVPFHIHPPHHTFKPAKSPYCGCVRQCLSSRQQTALRHHIKTAEEKKWKTPQPRLCCEL